MITEITGFQFSDHDTPKIAVKLIGFEYNYRPGPKFNIFWIPTEYVSVFVKELKRLRIPIEQIEQNQLSADF